MEKKKMKIWKKVVIVIAFLVLIFIILTLRKMLIILNLQNKISKYTDSQNYYAKSYLYQGDYLIITESYVKDNKYILYLNNLGKDRNNRIINYYDGMKTNTYIEDKDNKIAILDSNGLPSVTNIIDYAYTDNFYELLLKSIKSSVKTEECNGKECYYIEGGIYFNILVPEGKNGVYIEKESGLPVRSYNGSIISNERTTDCIIDYTYEFDTVKEEDIKEPEISQYSIQENNK